MKYQNVFKRYEMKYLMTKEQQQRLLSAISPYIKPDTYGRSTNRSLYLDTSDMLLIRRSMERPCYKEKLRVRSYGVAKEDGPVFIELKKKCDGIVYKRRVSMDCCNARDYLLYGQQPPQPGQITAEIDYFMRIYGSLEPRVLLSYDRCSFVSRSDAQLRLTFDENILARTNELSLTSPIYGVDMLQPDTVLLEVKTVMGLPEWLLGFLSENNLYKTSFSKYAAAYRRLILAGEEGGYRYVA